MTLPADAAPCYFCGGAPDRSVMVELPVTRTDKAGRLVTRAERRVNVCNPCGSGRRRRFPHRSKAVQARWAEWWSKQQESLF